MSDRRGARPAERHRIIEHVNGGYDVPDQRGRRFVVTGANSGTGKEAARRLARAGATVVLAVRSPERGEAARGQILREVPDADLRVARLDLADLASVRSFAAAELADPAALHVLVNNAGVMVPLKRILTSDGFELQLGTNFLGPFALTVLLVPKLLQAPDARVTTMSSIVAEFGRIRFRDLQWARGYRPSSAYAQSKLADLLLALHLGRLAERNGWPLLSTAAHPGYTRTNLQTAGRNLDGRQRRPASRTLLPSQDVEPGTEPLLVAATGPAARQGGYFGPSGRFALTGPTHEARLPRTARGPDLAASVWAVAEQVTGIRLSV